MRLTFAPGFTFNTEGETPCDTCGPRTSSTLQTITYDPGTGYGATLCRFHSVGSPQDGVAFDLEDVPAIIELWAKAERTARVLGR